jgi:hypothetical protein
MLLFNQSCGYKILGKENININENYYFGDIIFSKPSEIDNKFKETYKIYFFDNLNESSIEFSEYRYDFKGFRSYFFNNKVNDFVLEQLNKNYTDFQIENLDHIFNTKSIIVIAKNSLKNTFEFSIFIQLKSIILNFRSSYLNKLKINNNIFINLTKKKLEVWVANFISKYKIYQPYVDSNSLLKFKYGYIEDDINYKLDYYLFLSGPKRKNLSIFFQISVENSDKYSILPITYNEDKELPKIQFRTVANRKGIEKKYYIEYDDKSKIYVFIWQELNNKFNLKLGIEMRIRQFYDKKSANNTDIQYINNLWSIFLSNIVVNKNN